MLAKVIFIKFGQFKIFNTIKTLGWELLISQIYSELLKLT